MPSVAWLVVGRVVRDRNHLRERVRALEERCDRLALDLRREGYYECPVCQDLSRNGPRRCPGCTAELCTKCTRRWQRCRARRGGCRLCRGAEAACVPGACEACGEPRCAACDFFCRVCSHPHLS